MLKLRSEIENLTALFACHQLRICFERRGCFVNRVAGVVEAHNCGIKITAAFLARPNKPVDFFFGSRSFHHVGPRAVGAAR